MIDVKTIADGYRFLYSTVISKEKYGIYLYSNKSWSKIRINQNIGMTNLQPNDRMKSLSKATSIPANFELKYSKQVQKVKLIESRVHSQLTNCRFRFNKEFFEIDINNAIKIIEKISELTQYEGEISTEIGKHTDFIYSYYKPDLKLTELKLMDSTFAHRDHG